MLVFSVKTSSCSGSLARSTVIGPVWRQATEKFEGSSLRPSGWPQPPLRACDMWQVTPATLGSSKWLTHTLSFGDSRLKVVLMQPRSSALAGPDSARKTQAARYNSFKFGLPCRRRRRGSRGLRRHALLGQLAPRLRVLLQRQPHAAQDMRRLGELDVGIVDHLDAVAPGVDEIEEGPRQQLAARRRDEVAYRRAVVDDDAEMPVLARLLGARLHQGDEL